MEQPTPHDQEAIVVAEKHTRLTTKERVFCYKLIEGMSPQEAAHAAGMTTSQIANASRWIREDRESSKKPHLWDFMQALLKTKLRLFDVTVENVLNEMRLIAFGSIHHFLDFPTREELKAELDQAKALEYANTPGGIEEWKKYRIGRSIKLKAFEDIPPQLWPLVSEISEDGKGGIKLKLHDKLKALDMLGRYTAMYSVNKAEGDDIAKDLKEINITIAGEKSPLMKLLQGGGGDPVKELKAG